MLFALSSGNNVFPPVSMADSDGLLAVGGSLNTSRLLAAYEQGIFPWYNPGEPIMWFSPPQRCVIYPAEIYISKSMRKILRQNIFTVTKNQAFGHVIRACASVTRADGDGTWIGEDIITAFTTLHQLGRAISYEVWHNHTLAGGLYGVVVNNIFCGESMFSLYPNASKTALIHLCKNENYSLIDCQVPNPHLISMGARLISRAHFVHLLTSGS